MKKDPQKKAGTSFRCTLRENTWCVLLVVIFLELVVAYLIPPDVLSSSTLLAGLVGAMGQVAPVLGKVQEYAGHNAEAVRFYMTLVLLMVPLKVWLFYAWLNSDRNSVYRYLVITPLTDTKPAAGDNFVTDPLRVERNQKPKEKRRSVFSRVFWSTLILLITVGAWWAILGSENSTSPESEGLGFYREVASGSFGMWLEWALKHLTFSSFLTSVSACIVRDYLILFRRRVRALEGVGNE